MARSDVARSAVQRAIAWTNVNDMRIIAAHALVAQLDRVLPSEGSPAYLSKNTSSYVNPLPYVFQGFRAEYIVFSIKCFYTI